MFQIIRNFKQQGLLGVNKRNAEYTLVYNERKFYPLVDDKLKTKELAIKAQIAVPELYGIIESYGQLDGLPDLLREHSSFVIKPARGSGGKGVVVIAGRMKHMYRKESGVAMTDEEMRYHVVNILSGMYSLGGQPDKAMIEYRVKFDPVFEKIAYQGVPDVRIIVFMGIPVMAMVRLPTRMSDGKANLHQGAIGTGVDIATGKTLTAVWKNFIIDDHPDTGEPVVGLQIPGWDDLLRLASKSYELTGLGYQGIDVVLDKFLGPLILELNARPGLNIQIANNCGLENRILLAKKNLPNLKTVEEKVAFAKEHFRATF